MTLQEVAYYLLIFALPYFALLSAVEWGIAWYQQRKVYRFNDSVTSISAGVVDRVVDIFIKAGVLGAYVLTFEHFAIMAIPTTSPLAWILCFLLVDFCFYWAHRMCHTLNFLWACHVVHHSSEEMNYAVALRQSATETMCTWVFYIPLAVAGFPWEMWFICYQLNLLYQFWCHTRLVGKLGPLEYVMNTPSHHRVHHGADEKYIDKNHAGTFIIWDRLFGTFKEEEEEPIYGVVTPVKTFNPVWNHAYYWVRLGKMAWLAPRFADKLRVWVREPAYMPEGVSMPRTGPSVRDAGYEKYDVQIPGGLNIYVLAHFVVVLVLFTTFGLKEESLRYVDKFVPALLVLSSLVCLGGIFELRPWARFVEPLRILALGAVLALRGDAWFGVAFLQTPAGIALVIALAAASLLWIFHHRHDFHGAPSRAALLAESM